MKKILISCCEECPHLMRSGFNYSGPLFCGRTAAQKDVKPVKIENVKIIGPNCPLKND
jgi:hypothetical protein